jgi:hypothetical protein
MDENWVIKFAKNRQSPANQECPIFIKYSRDFGAAKVMSTICQGSENARQAIFGSTKFGCICFLT